MNLLMAEYIMFMINIIRTYIMISHYLPAKFSITVKVNSIYQIKVYSGEITNQG